MDDSIREALHKAYAGEAKAALRLKIFARKAEEEGYPQIGKLFRVIAFSEEIHGERALGLLRAVGNTEANLRESFESETHVAQTAYEKFLKMAHELGEEGAAVHFSQSRDVEEGHAKLYKNALNALMEDRDATYYVCSVCGYVSDGFLPDECPVCGAKKQDFVHFESTGTP